MNLIERFFYRLTALWPRKLPRTDAEMAHWKYVLREAFAVPDTEQSWLTLCGQITSTKPFFVRKALWLVANALHRMNFINPTAVKEKERNVASLQARLAEAVKREAEREAAEKTADIPIVEAQANGPAQVN